MAEYTGISWCHHTFNPWRGCTKVSPACDICYAETMSKRNPDVLGVWGRYGTRTIAAESYWKFPLIWNRKAKAAGERRRVFCASLADVFEGIETMPDNAIQDVFRARVRLFELIQETPYLDWLLLTKRPQNIEPLLEGLGIHGTLSTVMPNVWLGTTVENQKYANERIPELFAIPAAKRFLSMEPLLGAVDLTNIQPDMTMTFNALTGEGRHLLGFRGKVKGLDWVIVGGESGGQKARPMHPDWVRSLRDQCVAAGVPFHFKQWGEWWPMSQTPDFWCDQHPRYAKRRTILQSDGSDIGLQFPPGAMTCFRVGKEISGRLLDRREWNEVPEVSQ